jgi:hypothetical protein
MEFIVQHTSTTGWRDWSRWNSLELAMKVKEQKEREMPQVNWRVKSG